MKLSEYAAIREIGYRAAWNRYKAGKIAGAYVDETGHIVVPDPEYLRADKAVVYARVSSHKQKEDLARQADRMVAFANARGLEVVKVVTEVASGVNDERKNLTKLLKDESWGTLVVEHKDRLTRTGFNWFEVMLSTQRRTVLVANRAQEETVDLMDDFLSIVYSFAARLYGLRSAKDKTKAVKQALK